MPSTPGAPLFSTPLVRQPHVAALDHSLHQRGSSRFRSPATSPRPTSAPTLTPRRSSAPELSSASLSTVLLLHRSSSRSSSYSRSSLVRPFAVRAPTMASADFCDASRRLSTPVAHWQTGRSPRVLRTHLLAYACRIYAASFREVSGFDIFGRLTPIRRLIRFLFVRPALCLPLPSDSQSPGTPLPFG